MSTSDSRVARVTLLLDATPDQVWKALTEAEEITRWFSTEARVVPGAGGRVEWSWGDRFVWGTTIEAWEPGRLLRLVQEATRPFDLDGRPVAGGAPSRIVIEFQLEGKGGRTELRLAHSGFGRGASWDDEFDGVSNGWNLELRGLAYYLTRHRGRNRVVGWASASTRLDCAAVWRGLLGPGGFDVGGVPPAEGAPCTLRTPWGITYTGTSLHFAADREFLASARELDGGVVRLGAWRAGGETGVQLWLSVWDPGLAPHAGEFEARAREWLAGRFPARGG